MRLPVTPRAVVLVVLAFTAARWAAMGFNRIADRAFDARNPRTRNRELPRGALTLTQAWLSVILAAAVFVGSAALLNPLCLALSPVALAWVLGYSLSKRFTWWPHLWLGLGLAIAPVGGYLAVAGRWSEPAWTLLNTAGRIQHPAVQAARRDRIERIASRWDDPKTARVVAQAVIGLLEAGARDWLDYRDRGLDRTTELLVGLVWSGLAGLSRSGVLVAR